MTPVSNKKVGNAIRSLGIEEFVLYGEPKNEQEFNSMFRKVVGKDSSDSAILSSDPSDFGVTWSQVKPKIAELEAAEPMRLLRLERNRRLAETDWITLKAYSQGVEVHPIWKNYMQALRDLPYVCIHMTDDVPKLDEQGNLINVPWPDVPQPHHMKDY